MNRLYLLCVLLLLGSQLPAQLPFPTQSGTWRYYDYDDFGNFNGYWFFHLDGDSLYQGETWGQLYNGLIPQGLIREDSSHRVYIVPKDSSQPKLIYDFGSQIGDTIFTLNHNFITYADTVVIDTILPSHYLFPGSRVWMARSIRQDVSSWGPTYEWIEGIGDERWLPSPIPGPLVSGSTRIDCFSPISYTDPSNLCLVTAEAALKADWDFYPNPCRDQLRIQGPDQIQAAQFRLRNVQGQVLRSYPGTQRVLQLGNLPAGLFFLDIEVGGRHYTERISVEK